MDSTYLLLGIIVVLVLLICGISYFLYRSNRQFWIAEKCIVLQTETIETKTKLIEEQTALINVLRSQTEYLQAVVARLDNDGMKELEELVTAAHSMGREHISVESLDQVLRNWQLEKEQRHRQEF